MKSDRDPFGFKPRKRRDPDSQPITVIAQPGQEVRIVVPDTDGGVRGLPGDSRVSPKGSGDSRVSPKGSGDSRVSPKGSGDSRVSPKGSGDSRVSPKGSGDASGRDPFGFERLRPGYSPTPIMIVARSGQEIRIVVPDAGDGISGLAGDSRVSPKGSGDSRVSPKGSGDSRVSPKGSGDKRANSVGGG